MYKVNLYKQLFEDPKWARRKRDLKNHARHVRHLPKFTVLVNLGGAHATQSRRLVNLPVASHNALYSYLMKKLWETIGTVGNN
jgi:hypothetical protein